MLSPGLDGKVLRVVWYRLWHEDEVDDCTERARIITDRVMEMASQIVKKVDGDG